MRLFFIIWQVAKYNGGGEYPINTEGSKKPGKGLFLQEIAYPEMKYRAFSS